MNFMSEKTMTLWDLTEDNGLLTDGDWVESKDQDPNGTISLIQLADVKDGYFQRKSDRYLNEKTAKRLNCTFLEEGDVLVARLPDPLGRACIYPGDDRKAITAVDVCIIRIDKTKYNNRWLTHLINNPHFRKEINKFQSGTTRKRISKKNLSAIPFVVPEKKIQDAIADCIETQFTRLDVAIKSLKTMKAKLELYRKSVLKSAFEIADTTIVTIEEASSFIGSGITPKGSKQHYRTTGIPFIRSQNIHPFKFVTDGLVYVKESLHEEMRRTHTMQGDVLLNITGASIGRCAVIPDSLGTANVNQHVCIIRTKENMLPQYLCAYLNSPLGQNQIMATQGGVTRQGLNYQQIRKLKLPLPSATEQRIIIDEIESKFSMIDKISVIVNASLSKAEKLRKSILKSAFEGKLVD